MSQEQDKTGFLSRWSQRKLSPSEDAAPVKTETEAEDMPLATDVDELPDDVEHTEATAEDEKPLWQRDDVDAETKKAALRSLFRQPEFNVRDGLNEYDDDFTKFASLGNLVTHEMKRMLKLAEEKTRPEDSSQHKPLSQAEADDESPHNDNEDSDLA